MNPSKKSMMNSIICACKIPASTHFSNTLADGPGNVRAQENGAEEFEHAGEEHSLLDCQGLGSDGGSEGVSYIVSPDTESGEEGTEGTDDEDPQEGIRRLGGEDTIFVHLGAVRRVRLKRQETMRY